MLHHGNTETFEVERALSTLLATVLGLVLYCAACAALVPLLRALGCLRLCARLCAGLCAPAPRPVEDASSAAESAHFEPLSGVCACVQLWWWRLEERLGKIGGVTIRNCNFPKCGSV